jgi:hypothetical protein
LAGFVREPLLTVAGQGVKAGAWAIHWTPVGIYSSLLGVIALGVHAGVMVMHLRIQTSFFSGVSSG